MENAFAWLGKVMEWIGDFIPKRVILDVTMGGCKFIGGRKVKVLGPGVHWYWPFWTQLHTYPTARQADNLSSQTVVTTDDRTVVVGGMIVYEVADIEKILAHTYKPQDAIRDLALTAIHDVICQLSWEELKSAQRSGALDRKLRSECRAALLPYGVTTLKVQLTDLAPARVVRLVQSSQKDAAE